MRSQEKNVSSSIYNWKYWLWFYTKPKACNHSLYQKGIFYDLMTITVNWKLRSVPKLKQIFQWLNFHMKSETPLIKTVTKKLVASWYHPIHLWTSIPLYVTLLLSNFNLMRIFIRTSTWSSLYHHLSTYMLY